MASCQFYDHTNPFDPDYKGVLPLVKSVKQIYEIGIKANCIKALSGNNIFVGTNDGVYHYDGNNWSKMIMPISALIIRDIKAIDSNNVYSIGLPNVYDNYGNNFTYLLKFDGSNWKILYKERSFNILQTGQGSNEYVSLSIVGIDNIYLAYSAQADNSIKNRVIRWDHGNTQIFQMSEIIYDIQAFSDNSVFVLGTNNVWSYNGTNYDPYIDIKYKSYNKFQALNPQTIFLFGGLSNGDPALYKYKDGNLAVFSTLTNQNEVKGVYFIDENFGLIVTINGDFVIYNKGAFTTYNIFGSNSQSLYDVQLLSDSTGYAVGSNGIVLKYGDFPLER
jgi:hypothetical protein